MLEPKIHTKNIYAIDVIEELEPGIIVRIATNDDLKKDQKIRLTHNWHGDAELDICYEKKSTSSDYREFILSTEAIDEIKTTNRIYLDKLGYVPPRSGWVISTSEIILVCETIETEKTMQHLIRVETTEKGIDIQTILLSSNPETVSKLKALNEKAIKGTEKEETVEYRVLNVTVPVRKTQIKRHKETETK